MFVLTTREEKVKLPPAGLHSDTSLSEAIRLELNTLYCNKVVPGAGLAIAVWDILDVGEPMVHPGEPFICLHVRFRLVLLRPFPGEILVGQVRSSTSEGVHVALGFFDDILIPARCMQLNTLFDPTEQTWVWKYAAADGSVEGSSSLFIDKGELVRFRVIQEAFSESKERRDDGSLVVPPYRILGSIAEDGLGLLSWWSQ